MRVPVTIKRSSVVPDGFAAWVPVKRTILIAPHTLATPRLIAHELAHVLQAESAVWPLAYVLQWIANGFKYESMPYEVQARKAEVSPVMLEWARDVLRGFEA